MLLAILLHLLIFHLLTASDAPPRDRKDTQNKTKHVKDSEYRITHINTCPDVGFFFQREATANSLIPDACFLCFCQGDHTAVCWKRDNRRCNTESFHYHGIGKRDKRSPGFTDIFFRDASRDFFNKNTQTQCKPYESSFSDDCPPVDWCTGCTVCDCDANGRWDCHLLSFCPDGKKKSSKRKGTPPNVPESWKPYMDKKKEKIYNSSPISAPNTRPTSNKYDKIPKKSYNKAKPQIQRAKPQIKREDKKKPPPIPKRIVEKRVPLKPGVKSDPGKIKTPIKYRKIAPNKKNSTKEMIIKKDIATRKPIEINKSNKFNLEMELAHKLMKKVMQSLKKTITASAKTMGEIAKQNANNVRNMKAKAKLTQAKKKPKNVSKRQIKKPNMKPSYKNKKEPMKKPIYRATGNPPRKIGTKTYIRHKRDVTMPGNIGIPASVTHGNSVESTNTTVALTVIPVTSIPVTSKPVTSIPVSSIPDTSSSPVLDDGNFSQALIGSTTLQDNKYYKYTVGSEEPRTKLDLSIGDTTTTQFNITETVFNLLGAQLTSIVSTAKRHVKNNEQNKSFNSKEINPEENGLKFSKWINLNILKEKKISSESDIKDKRLMKLLPHTNKTIHIDDKNRNHGKKVQRKLNYRKKNMVKLLNHSKYKFDNCKINNSNNIHMPNKNNGDVHDYRSTILNNHHKNSTTYPPKRKRKPGVLKYLKRIFNKIFKGRRTPDKMSKHQLIKTLCENFGPCLKVNRKARVLLNSKLSDLDRETTRILKTVKIIKGLLKLLVLPESINSNFSKQEHFGSDMQKLNNILKGIYSENGQVKLTATQLTQIDYIKKSTQDFIQSVSRFALLLNEIIIILTKQDTNRFRNKEAKNDFMDRNLSKDDPFQSLKNLLLKYNLVQNTFMKQMYEQLHNFEYKINEKSKVSESKDLNNSVTIENISRNIIHNLRQLKHLAQTGSYSGRERVRTKRNTGRDDDAVEYLLLLMEYLIKQNHPLDAEPVNDGIDLLIEAIKNAPDIKPIRKKVLQYTPVIYSDTTTTTTSPRISNSATSEDTKSEDDSPSESGKTSSSEDSSKTKLEENENKLKENKDFVEVVADDEKEFEDKLQFDRRAEPDKMDEITELAFFSKLRGEDNIMVEPENLFETTTAGNTIMPLETERIDKLDNSDDLNLEKTLAENNNLDKPIDYSEAGGKKIEVFTGDMDEETILQSTVTTESDVPTTMATEFLSQAVKAQTSKAKIKYNNLESYDNDSGDKKSKLKWIEENFGKETEKEFTDLEENNSTLGITPVTAKTITAKTLDKIDVSGLTREKGEVRERDGEKEKDEIEKKTTAKISAEEIMLRKQMELLNSLDYGTERAEVFESDSKDSNIEERYTGDSFPAYFV